MRNFFVSACLVTALSAPAVGWAADGIPARVRGTIEQISETTLTVTSRDGKQETIALSPDYQVRGVKAANAADIKAGDFVGVASVPSSAGGDGAVEVLIFPANMKGTGEGSYPWDLKPNSTMTNATVSNAVKDVNGRSLTLSYPDGTKTIALPDGIPVVTFAEATRADLTPGAKVFVPSTKDGGGKLTTHFVVVGTNGVVPPM